MEALSNALNVLGPTGFVLSTENRAALASSMVTLQANEKFESLYFWGTVVGTQGNYFIAQGLGAEVEIKPEGRKLFYSQDCVTWAQLPEVHQVIANSAKKIRKRFTGTASNEFTVSEPGPSADEAPVDLPAEVAALRKTASQEDGVTITTTISEDKRLSALVRWIDEECAVLPHGALTQTAAGQAVLADYFSGLTPENATKLSSWVMYRVPQRPPSALQRAQQDKSLDFLDSLEDEVPNGSWTIQHGSDGANVLVKSLVWPGFVAYHSPGSKNFGYIYNGIGQCNSDLAFMLN